MFVFLFFRNNSLFYKCTWNKYSYLYFSDVEYNIILSVIFIFIEYVGVQVYVSYRPFLLFEKKRNQPKCIM